MKSSHLFEFKIFYIFFFCLSIFSCWTICHQLSFFLDFSWDSLKTLFLILLIPVLVISHFLSKNIGEFYISSIADSNYTIINYKEHKFIETISFFSLVGIIFLILSKNYQFKFSILLILIFLLFVILSYTYKNKIISHEEALTHTTQVYYNVKKYYFLLFLAAFIVISVVILSNRSDFDDASYMQFAQQTIQNPNKPLYSFDASLGFIINQFRFAPYQIVSYETFIALISELFNINLLHVYYLIIPTISALLSIFIAFIFIRWFLPINWAFITLFIFIVIILSWGESHIAYGNRVYVRLFQGKGLLIALTTPFMIIMSLLWMRTPRSVTWIGLLLGQIISIGVSSTGLVLSLVTVFLGLIAGLLTTSFTFKAIRIFSLGMISTSYALALGFWLKYHSSTAGKIENIGTFLPINASLGLAPRENITLLTLFAVCTILMPYFLIIKKDNSYKNNTFPFQTFFWLIILSLLLVLNPFFIPIITHFITQNMSWRLAWGTPIPLLLAIGFGYLIRYSFLFVPNKKLSIFFTISILSLILTFVFVDKTVLSKNNAKWGFSQHKVPKEYYEAQRVVELLKSSPHFNKFKPVLIDPQIGAWIAVVDSDIQLIMLGHTYPIVLKTIMDPIDFNNRLFLIQNFTKYPVTDDKLNKLLHQYNIGTIVYNDPTASNAHDKYSIKFLE